ncbi:MAG: response regulator [Nitrospinae bacterium]|nr:response regulator [Nitrospinota bacterium]
MGINPRKFQVYFVLLTLGSVVASAVILFMVAYKLGSDSIKSEAMRTVCATAIGKVDNLLNRLTYQKHTLDELMALEASQCGGGDPKQFEPCVKRVAAQFLKVQKVQSIRFETSDPKTVFQLGEPSPETVFDPGLKKGQLARFYAGGSDDAFYVIQAESADRRNRAAARFSAKNLDPLFKNENLGVNGESFLADPKGFFLTTHKYRVESGKSHPIDAKPMSMCLGGKSGETVGSDYAGVPIIHGFRYVPEIGGGCVMAHMDVKEAFAGIDRFAKKWWIASTIIWAVMGLASYAMSRRLGRQLGENVEEVKRVEAEMEGVNRQLAERTRQAEEANRSKSEFLANMSHEIRTPLNAIIGMTHLIGQTALNIRQRDQLFKIHSSAELLLGVINDVLDFSKIEAGMLEIESVPFELSDALEHISAIISDKAKEKNLELLYSISPDAPRILVGDPLRLSQVVLNLLSNAVKFTQRGQVVLSVSVASVADAGNVAVIRFSVADSGVGITEEQMKKLFNPFSQADASTTRRHGGTGLGLVLCKRLVGLMKGTIQSVSEPGKGSVFSFELPLGFEGGPPYCPLVPEELRGMRALVVDDNEVALGVMKAMLESFSFSVTVADSVRAAVEELERASLSLNNRYRLVLMDWRMPDMDGITGARLIINDKKIPDLPVILMASAFMDEAVSEQAREAGVGHFLHKPIQPSALLGAISEAFGVEPSGADKRAKKWGGADLTTRLRGSMVLLVDDNAINREVGRALLTGAGMVVVSAKSGEECIEILEGSPVPFDAVFMDVQMPEMDGYETTRTIRRNPRFGELPIIALTAHAMVEEKRKCIEAGMNDHISKPIRPETLSKVLVKWVVPRQASQGRTSADGGVPHEPRGAKVADRGGEAGLLPSSIPGLNLEQFVKRCGGDEILALRLLRTFLTDQSGAAEKVYAALEKKDAGSVAQTAHLLKGVAGNLAAPNLENAAGLLERAAGEGDTGEIAKKAEVFKNELNAVLKAVASLDAERGNSRRPTRPEAAGDPALLRRRCEELYSLLCKHSMKFDDLLNTVVEMARGTDIEAGMEKVFDHANRFEFEKAAEALKGLMTV